MVNALIRAARPLQWTKNALVLAAPAAAGVLDQADVIRDASLAVVAFSAAASGTYLINDVVDLEADRRHPKKRHRPIASGEVSPKAALTTAGVLMGVAAGLAAVVGRESFWAALVAYVVLTISYSFALKHMLVLDLVAVAGGFVLRAVAGAAAVAVDASVWFLLTTSFAALFVVTGKRFAEVGELGSGAGGHRPILDEYPITFLRTVLAVMLAATMVAYCLWAFESGEANDLDIPLFELSIVPVVTALLRYQLLLETGHGGAPEEVMTGDRTIQVLGLVWASLFILGVYAA